MRKFTLLLLIAGLLAVIPAQSQTPGTKGNGEVFYSTTFDWGNPDDPKGWTAPEGFYLYDPDDTGHNFEWMANGPINDFKWTREPAMQSTSASDGYLILFISRYQLDHIESNVPMDNGVVFPPFDCSSRSSVVVSYETCFMNYNDNPAYKMSLEVSVDNWVHAAAFDASFGANWKQRPLLNPPGIPVLFQANISEVAAGQPNVLMRLRWSQGVLYFWEVDDFKVSEAWNNDLQLKFAQMEWTDGDDESVQTPFYNMPKSQLLGNSCTNFKGSALNFGELDQENAYFQVDITKNNQSVFNKQGTPKDMWTLAIDTTLITDSYTPTDFGHYKVTYNYTSDATDEFPSNNTKVTYFNVTDSAYSHCDDTSEETYNWGAYRTDSQPLLAQVRATKLPIYADCEANSVSLYFAGGLADGMIDFHATIYKANPDNPLAGTDVYELITGDQYDYDSTMLNKWITYPLSKDGETEFLKAGDILYVGFEYNNMHTEYLVQRYDDLKPGSDKSMTIMDGITMIREGADWAQVAVRNPLIRLNIDDHSNFIDGVDLTAKSAWVGQNYPNPFTGSTVIDYELPAAAEVSFTVMDLTGRKVMEENQGMMSAGKHNYTLKTSSLDAGVYFYTLQAGSFTQTKQMVVN